jgi:methanogenic corrinoid protein MtbC1
VETIYIDLLAPAARHLGDLWTVDSVDFVQVTLGLGRLQQILRDLSPVLQARSRLARSGRHILLCAVPGEQHTFGLVMVAEFFLHAGWNVEGGPMTSADEMALMVGRDWFDVVGLSLASPLRIDQLTRDICAIRAASRNAGLAVMVGGPLFIDYPEYVQRVGADGMAASGQNAPVEAEALLVRLRGMDQGADARA